jgi:hypothetical protein
MGESMEMEAMKCFMKVVREILKPSIQSSPHEIY